MLNLQKRQWFSILIAMTGVERARIACSSCLTMKCRENNDGKVTVTTYEGKQFSVSGTIFLCPVLHGEIDESMMLFESGQMGLLLLYQELIEDNGE